MTTDTPRDPDGATRLGELRRMVERSDYIVMEKEPFVLMLAVIDAADRRRQAQLARRIVTGPNKHEWDGWKRLESDYWSALNAEDTALAALHAHLAPTAAADAHDAERADA